MIKIHENSHHFFFQISFFKMQFLEKYLILYSHFFLRVTRGAHNSNLQVPVVLKVDSVIQLLNNWGQVVRNGSRSRGPRNHNMLIFKGDDWFNSIKVALIKKTFKCSLTIPSPFSCVLFLFMTQES